MTGRGTAVGRVCRLGGAVLLLLGVTSVRIGAAPNPTVKFVKPADGATLADDSALIEVSYAGSEEHPIVRVEVYVEGGGPHFVYRPPRPEAQGTCSFSWALAQVPAGQQRLRARATDSEGRVGSASVAVMVEAAPQADPRRRLQELQRRLRRVRPGLEILRQRGQQLPPEFFGEGGGLWTPTNPPRARGRRQPYFGPEPTSQYWYPTLPARPFGKGGVPWGELQIIRPGPGGEGTIIIPRGGELQDVWPRGWPRGQGEYRYEFRLPDGRGRGTIRIVPPALKEKKAPEKEPTEKDDAKGEP